METKTFEIRDVATFIPALAVKLDPGCDRDRYLLSRAGYGVSADEQGRYVLLIRIDGGSGEANSDYYNWYSRTMRAAHKYIADKWDLFPSGSVIDAEWILGLSEKPKESEEVAND